MSILLLSDSDPNTTLGNTQLFTSNITILKDEVENPGETRQKNYMAGTAGPSQLNEVRYLHTLYDGQNLVPSKDPVLTFWRS